MGTKNNEVANTFAQWVSKTHYNVTFDPTSNGTIVSGNAVVDRYEGQMITSADIPTCAGKDHYTFKSWNPTFVDHAVTKHEKYTAVLEYVAANVHFDTGENGEKVNDIIVDRGSGIDNAPRPRHKSGIFVGWCSDSGLQNVVDFNTWEMPTPAVETTFYAKWDLNAAKRVVSYVVNGGTASFASVVKVLLDGDGWASTSGSFTLAEANIPTVTADQNHERDPVWSPRNPLGAVLSDAATFTATFAVRRLRVQIIPNEHLEIENGDQTIDMGTEIQPIKIRPKRGWGFGYYLNTLDDFSINGLKADYGEKTDEIKNILILQGSPTSNVTKDGPTCYESNPFRFIGKDFDTCEEISVDYKAPPFMNEVGGTLEHEFRETHTSAEEIWGFQSVFRVAIRIKAPTIGYQFVDYKGNPINSTDESMFERNNNDDIIWCYVRIKSKPGTARPLEIHQTVAGDQANSSEYFKYELTLNDEVKKLVMQGTEDAIFDGLPDGTYNYSLKCLDSADKGYDMTVTSGSLTGTVNTSSGVPAIIGIKHVKGNENMGSLLVNVTSSPDMYINQKLTDTMAMHSSSCEITVELSDKTFNNDQFTNGVTVFTFNGLRPGQSGQFLAEGLPTCNYVVNGELTSETWPNYVPRYINRVEENTIGQIMNTTRSTSTINFNYNQATVLLTIDGENILNQSSTVGISLHDDQNVLLEDITDKYGSYNVVNGQCVITNAVSKFGQTLRFLQVPCARLNISADTDSLPWYGDVQVYKDGSIIDRHTTFVQLEDNTTYNFNIKYSIIPGVAKPDPNCNIADVQINGVSVESGVTTFDWNQSLKLIYKNPLQTGGLNALWAAFGETEYTDLVTTSDASVSISSSEVEATWSGLGQDQYDLANSLKDTKPFLQIYDENGLPSQFVIINIGCTQKKNIVS